MSLSTGVVCRCSPLFALARVVAVITTGARWTVGIGLLAAVLLVSGCSDDGGDNAPQAPTRTATASASPSATPEPPALPDAARVLDRPGAEAFVRHYFDLINYANRTGDTEALDSLATDDCHNCKPISAQAKSFTSNGGHLRGGDIMVTHAVAAPIEDDVALVSTVIAQSEGEVVSRDGSVRESFSALDTSSISFYAIIIDDRWMVYDFAETAT